MFRWEAGEPGHQGRKRPSSLQAAVTLIDSTRQRGGFWGWNLWPGLDPGEGRGTQKARPTGNRDRLRLFSHELFGGGSPLTTRSQWVPAFPDPFPPLLSTPGKSRFCGVRGKKREAAGHGKANGKARASAFPWQRGRERPRLGREPLPPPPWGGGVWGGEVSKWGDECPHSSASRRELQVIPPSPPLESLIFRARSPCEGAPPG